MTGSMRAGVIVYRKNHAASLAMDFMGDGQPARHVGTILFDLAAPPFKHRTTGRETIGHKKPAARANYLVPSKETLCYLVAPRPDAIQGALQEHRRDQNLDSPAWANIIRSIRGIAS